MLHTVLQPWDGTLVGAGVGIVVVVVAVAVERSNVHVAARGDRLCIILQSYNIQSPARHEHDYTATC